MKILIADDEVIIRRFISTVLTECGYTCLEAEDGHEAVDLAVLENPDLILIDLNMPVVNGWEAIRAIRRTPKLVKVPIICVSGSCHGEMKNVTFEAGVDYCIEKPFDIQVLLEKISLYLS